MKTTHKILFQDSRDLKNIPSESVDMVVTSPPYPMIEMWDEVFRVLKNGRFACINKRNKA